MKRVLLVAAALVVGGLGIYLFLQFDEQSRIRTAARDEIVHVLESEKDAPKVLRLCSEALEESPEDASLFLFQGRAYHMRGRFSDALESFGKAELYLGEDQEEEHRFLRARSLLRRFLDTGERGDFNVAEGDLQALSRSGSFDDAASILLGMGLARKDVVRHRDEAVELIEKGLKSSRVGDLVDVDRARQILDKLR